MQKFNNMKKGKFIIVKRVVENRDKFPFYCLRSKGDNVFGSSCLFVLFVRATLTYTLRKKCYNDVDPPHPVSFSDRCRLIGILHIN